MESDDETILAVKIARIIADHNEQPTWYIAEKIIQLCLRDEFNKLKSRYERLFYTSTDNKN